MVLLEFSEYHYFDDVLSDLKLTPVSIIWLMWGLLDTQRWKLKVKTNGQTLIIHNIISNGASINKKSIDV